MLSPTNPLDPAPLHLQSNRQWIDIDYTGSVSSTYIDTSATSEKPNMSEAAQTINRYPPAQYRLNAEGMVMLRGLLRRTSGTYASPDVALVCPKAIQPRHNFDMRHAAGNYLIRYDWVAKSFTINTLLAPAASDWINLDGIVYYLD